MSEKKSFFKNKRFLSYVGVVALILAALIISLLFYRQKIEVTRDVIRNLTEDWTEFKSDKFGFSLKYPEDWDLEDLSSDNILKKDQSIMYIFNPKEGANDFNTIRLRVSEKRVVDYVPGVGDAIQISIPFDKKNYLIFSTSTNNEFKEIFYNIPVTLNMN